MANIHIEKVIKPNYSLIYPNMIYNRPDLQMNDNEYYLLHAKEENNDFYIPYSLIIDDKGKPCAEMGVWLSSIPTKVFTKCAEYIFANHSNITRVRYKNCLTKAGYYHKGNHYSIKLPLSYEKLTQRLSRKKRYNIRREKRILNDAFPDCNVSEYTSENVPCDVLEAFFEFKVKTYGTHYNMTGKEYLRKYHVTDVYVLTFNNKPHAIMMSCEQLPIVYLENTAYDPQYASFSLGQILYDIYLEKLIYKAKQELYLGGGNKEYKTYYGSEERNTYTGVIYRNLLIRCASCMYGFLNRVLDSRR